MKLHLPDFFFGLDFLYGHCWCVLGSVQQQGIPQDVLEAPSHYFIASPESLHSFQQITLDVEIKYLTDLLKIEAKEEPEEGTLIPSTCCASAALLKMSVCENDKA